MPISGTLALKVHRIAVQSMDADHADVMHAVRFSIGRDEHATTFAKLNAAMDELVQFQVNDASDTTALCIELLQKNKTKALVDTSQLLSNFFKRDSERKMTFTFGPKATPYVVMLCFNINWEPANPVVTVLDMHRPWFTCANYYYYTAKRVYDYATSFRVVAPFARTSENVANTVLTRVSGKTLQAIDTAWVGPGLCALDAKVDASLSMVLTTLHAGQSFAHQKNAEAVEKATQVVNQTKDKISAVTDYTKSQVVHVSTATFGTLKDVTTSVLRHVPVIGPKLVA